MPTDPDPDPEFTDPDSLPTHYRDDGQTCEYSGTVQPQGCPRGCDHAPHYSNDGHEACYDPAPVRARAAKATPATHPRPEGRP